MANEIANVSMSHAMSVSFENMQRMAASMAKSQLFGFKDADQVLSLMLLAQAEGRSPALVARDFHLIQNRPAKKAESMMRDFQAAGGKIVWNKLDDTIADATFSHPQGGELRITWDLARAEKAGLTQKDGSMYKKYPRAMLRSRVVSEGVRSIWPGATSGMYTPEEGRDIAEEIDVTPVSQNEAVAQAVQSATALTLEEVESHVEAMSDALTLPTLQTAYLAAHEHAKQARDVSAKKRFTEVYNLRAEDIKSHPMEAQS